MVRGIDKSDPAYRHFKFNEEDTQQVNGEWFYKVTYDKTSDEDDDVEIGYVKCSNVFPLGGKKLKPVGNAVPETPKPVTKVAPVVQTSKSSTPIETEVKEATPSIFESDDNIFGNVEPTVVNDSKPVKETKSKKSTSKTKVVETSNETYTVDTSCNYEYTVSEIKTANIDGLQKELNKKGKDGWELCGFDTLKTLFGDIQAILVFKKRV